MPGIRFSLRTKLMLFAAVIALLPLLVAGQSLIRVTRDELKSAANEQLAATASKLGREFNDFLDYTLLTPLDLVRNAIAGDRLAPPQKVEMLKQAIADLPDVVALQINVQGVPQPIIVAQESYFSRLKPSYPDPIAILRTDPAMLTAPAKGGRVAAVTHLDKTGDWLATIAMPIEQGIAGREATLYARIDLSRLGQMIRSDPFAKTGTINVLDADRNVLFSTGSGSFDHASVVDKAVEMLASGSASIAVEPFPLADGTISLGAIVLPRAFPWAIVAEKSETDAYEPIADMIRSLLLWLGIGLAAAILGAALFALGISRPILRVSQTALRVAGGDLHARVGTVRSRDEIGELATRFDAMIVQLNERFELQKFVSRETMKAIQGSDARVVKLGGERRRAAMLFADIRGYTSFSENRDPAEVVNVLNGYFQRLSDIVMANHGDIDKFVGDQIMAVFDGRHMAKHAVQCALQMMEEMPKLGVEFGAELKLGIGIHVGEVVAGAMGSSHRKDFTVLGDSVNLAARMCSNAQGAQTLITRDIYDELPKKFTQMARALEPIKVKGKSLPIEVYAY